MDFSKPTDPEEMRALVKEDVRYFEEATRNSLGYPRNWLQNPLVDELLGKLLPFGVHNLGDWETGSRYDPNVFHREKEVMSCVYELFECDEKASWGYVDDSGTTGNLWAVAVGREVLRKRNGGKPPVFICSDQAHYSFGTAMFMSGLDHEAVASNEDGSVDIAALVAAIEKHKDRPILMGILNGTTVREGRDDIDAVIKAALGTGKPREDFFFHVDGAFSSMYLALLREDTPANITPSFRTQDIDSLSVSGHKIAGPKRTSGIYLTRRAHSEASNRSVEYIKGTAKTMGGSRDGLPIYELWLWLKCVGTDQMRDWARACISKAQETAQRMRDAGVKNVLLNPYATTIYFTKPSKRLMDLHRLAPEGGGCHLIVEPHILNEFGGFGSLDRFMEAFEAELSVN